MALQGTLKDFSITEIIQLIGQQLKTGVLTIRRGKKVVEISFVDGMIVHVYSSYRGKKDLIGEILVKAKRITEEQLDRVLRIQKGTLKYLGEILVELQLLTKDDVLKVISTQVYEIEKPGGDAGGIHQLGGQDEQRDRQEQEVIDSVLHPLGQHGDVHPAAHFVEVGQQAGHAQRVAHRYA